MPATVLISQGGASLVIDTVNGVTHAFYDPFTGVFVAPHALPAIPAPNGFRNLLALPAGYHWAWTFSDRELDTFAMEYWWHTHGPGPAGHVVQRPNPDIFKNNKWSQRSRNMYSVVARLLKQGGAKELLGVDSPRIDHNWTEILLTNYANNIAAAAGGNGALPQVAQVADRTRAQR
jgi:hypothetical protein